MQMPRLPGIRIWIIMLLTVCGTGCQTAYLQSNDIQTIMTPSFKLEGKASIKLETGEVVTDRYSKKGFGVEDQIAFVKHLKEELEASNCFESIDLNSDSPSDYRINIFFRKTAASGGGLLGIYYLDVELKIIDHEKTSLETRYEVSTPENKTFAFFADTTIRATKARAANELHQRVMQDINLWLQKIGGSKRKQQSQP